jgi:glycosyltransferase involved in cell wall biosynthesis
MKVLFIGVYRDGTGWAHAAIDYILALDHAGVDVVPRPIRFNALKFPVPERILELEQKSSFGCDIVIQHILPHFMEYNGNFKKNIAMFELESTSFAHTTWPEHINMMNIAWLTSTYAKDICEYSNVSIPTEVVLHTTDVSKYQKQYAPLDIPAVDGEFIFYTIADVNNRKNLSALIRAFHTEFDPSEPVSLLIKATRYGQHPAKVLTELQNHCNQVKAGLKLHSKMEYYKPEILVPNVTDDETVYRLHNTCDCFVMPSCGEAWCIPAFDAMAFGKTPIVTNWSGFLDYMTEDTGWLANCYMQQAFGGSDSFQSIYTGREKWAVVDIEHLGKCMRQAYENEELREQKAEAGKLRAYDFSYDVIGPKLRSKLESYVQQ